MKQILLLIMCMSASLAAFSDYEAAPRIICDDFDENGVLTAWRDHVFYLSDEIKDIDNGRWHFTIPLTYETFETDLEDNAQSCVVTKLFDYFHLEDAIASSDGIMTCILDYSYYKDGILFQLEPVEVKLDLRPKIFEVNFPEIEFNESKTFYIIHFEVKYGGDNMIYMSAESEYSFTSRSEYLRQPEIATGITMRLDAEGYSWIDFMVSNKYGKAFVKYEFEPNAVNWYPVISEIVTTDIYDIPDTDLDNTHECVYSVYDICGNLLWSGTDLVQLRNISYQGLAIVRCCSENHNKSFKITL